MKNTIRLFAFSFLVVSMLHAEEFRSWTSDNSRIEAEFVDLSADGATITLKNKDGMQTNIALEKLSREDQKYVKKIFHDKFIYFTGLRCEYVEIMRDGKSEKVFWITDIVPGSPADLAETGWTSEKRHRYYLKPDEIPVSVKNIIDGMLYYDEPEFPCTIFQTTKEYSKTLTIKCVSRNELNKIGKEMKAKRELKALENRHVLAAERAKRAAEEKRRQAELAAYWARPPGIGSPESELLAKLGPPHEGVVERQSEGVTVRLLVYYPVIVLKNNKKMICTNGTRTTYCVTNGKITMIDKN